MNVLIVESVSYAYLGSHLSKLSKTITSFFPFSLIVLVIFEKILSNCSGEKLGKVL